MKKIIVLLHLAILTVFACKTPSQNQTTPIPFLEDQPQLLFLNLTIEQKNNQTKVELIEKRITKGKIKRDYKATSTTKPFHLKCSFLDKDKKNIKQTTIPNPLMQRYEYTDENGQLTSKMVASESGQITLRTQIVQNLHFLKVESIEEDGQLELIQILALE